jgi:methionyl-tRNA synthetase
MTDNHFYITTPIYYVNDRPHIGHAYTSIACDVLARFMRLSNYKVKFLTGTDEHGQKVEKSAAAAGVTPQALADANSQHFREMGEMMKLSNDDFIRTTEPRHKKAAQALWKKMEEAGHIYLGSYSGWYSVRDEAYYQESELVGGKAPTGADVEWVEEPSYFFKLSAFSDKLLAFYDKNPGCVMPESRLNEVKSFVKGGLKDLSISRTTFSWGIPVPIPPACGGDVREGGNIASPSQPPPQAGEETHIMYVWLDALTNYLSALGYPENTPDMKTFWPADLHMVGKDIVRFHAVYWPAFLMAANLPTPRRVFAHGWWTIEGEKMSKSLGNVVAPADLILQFGLDQTRWFLMREVPFGQDGNFARERMTAVINSELANNIGNLVQRTLSMIHKNCGGSVPDPQGVEKDELDLSFLEKVHVTKTETPELVRRKYTDCKFNEILGDIVAIASEANLYIDTKAPWKQKKTDERLMNATLYHLVEAIRCIAIMIQPFIPDTAAKILTTLGYDAARAQAGISFAELAPVHAITPGTALLPPQPLFPKIEIPALVAGSGSS